MTDNQTQQKIDDLIKEVEAEINSTQLTKQERGQELAMTALAYAEAMTEINKNYVEAMNDLLDKYEELNKDKKDLEHASRLTKVKINLYK